MAEPVIDQGLILGGQSQVLAHGLDHRRREDRSAGHGQEPDQGGKKDQPQPGGGQVAGESLHQSPRLPGPLQTIGKHHNQADDGGKKEEFFPGQGGEPGGGDDQGEHAEKQSHNDATKEDGQGKTEPQSHADQHQDERGNDLEKGQGGGKQLLHGTHHEGGKRKK